MSVNQPRSAPLNSTGAAPPPGRNDRSSSSSANLTADVPRPKRIACVVCRKRKLRCDGSKPSCSTCSRLGHDCAYDEVRRKSGPKRGYVKALEARLAQVETLLKDQSGPDTPTTRSPSQLRQLEARYGGPQLIDPPLFGDGDSGMDGMGGLLHPSESHSTNGSPAGGYRSTPPLMDIPLSGGDPIADSSMWEMMAMGLEEALPSPEIVDSLTKIYFEKVHPTMAIIHKPRYFASLDLAPNLRPPVALRYAMWTLAASVSEEYATMQTHFYRRARKYLEETEMKGHGESIIAVASSQAWALVTCYEFKLMYFPRAWMSAGRAVRLAEMMGLHRLDGVGLEVKQCIPAPRDWIEREERRRTFWFSFCLDRYASIGTGWPMIIEEKDILTNLPVADESFLQGRPAKSLTLKEAMTAEGASLLSPMAGVCLMASLFGRNLIHLHRPDPDERDDDLNGEFWRRHRHMDNVLLNIALSLPPHFRLPAGINDPNIVFTNMKIHTSTICLHQAAIFKADKNRMPSSVSAESKIRCITAAAEIASIMRMVCHLDLSGMNPFISFCLYVAARVFVQYLKSRPSDEQVRASLQFLLTAMGHMKKKNPLTESFLVQLDVDLTGSLDERETIGKFPYTQKKGVPEAPPATSINPSYPTPHPVTEIITSADVSQPLPTCLTNSQPGQGERHRPSSINSPQLDKVLEGYPGMSPHNSHQGQSPSSLDMSEKSQNTHSPSSHASPSQNDSSNSSYSPIFNPFNPGTGMEGLDGGGYMSKDMMENWEMMGMGPNGYDSDMTGLNPLMTMTGMNGMGTMNPEFSEFFAESTA